MPNPIPTQDLQKNSADLQELRDRVNFAESEIKALGNEVVSYRKNSVTLTRRPIPGRDAHDVYLAKSTELPVGIRVKIGNITNDLRACLDGLACVLAIRNGKDTKGVYFPISRDKNAFNADGMQKLRKLSSNDQDKITALAPYGGPNDILLGLHDLDITRKHVRLTTFGSTSIGGQLGGAVKLREEAEFHLYGTTLGAIYVEQMSYWTGRQLGSGANEVLIATGVPAQLEISVECVLVFEEPQALLNRPVGATLREFASKVSSIIELFD